MGPPDAHHSGGHAGRYHITEAAIGIAPACGLLALSSFVNARRVHETPRKAIPTLNRLLLLVEDWKQALRLRELHCLFVTLRRGLSCGVCG